MVKPRLHDQAMWPEVGLTTQPRFYLLNEYCNYILHWFAIFVWWINIRWTNMASVIVPSMEKCRRHDSEAQVKYPISGATSTLSTL